MEQEDRSMNKVVLVGRLTRDPEIKYTQGQPSMCIATYTLAVDRRGAKKDGQQTADFISCIAFGKAGEFAEKYLHKGMKIAVSGHIQTGSYAKQDGTKVYTTDVVLDSQEFCESKQSADNSTATQQSGIDGFMQIPDGIDEALPFN
jgi:single-strand DNA-binding protein